jgi:hypothetical protein
LEASASFPPLLCELLDLATELEDLTELEDFGCCWLLEDFGCCWLLEDFTLELEFG